MMARRNIVAALVLMGIGAWYGVLTATLPERTLPNTPGPSFFPWLITGALLILSAGLLVQGLTSGRTEKGQNGDGFPAGRGLYALIWFAVYLAVLPYVGFLFASVPFFGGLMVLYGGRHKLFVGVAAVAVPLLLFFIFRHGFQILLPRGIL